MPAGLEVINETGSYQIDGNYANLALVRKGSVQTQGYMSGDGIPTLQTRALVTVNDGELIAFSCATAPAVISAKVGNQVYLSANGVAGTVINYWIFAAGTGVSNYGLQVFDESGAELVFDSSWRLFNVVAVTTGVETIKLNSGRVYAVLPQSVRIRINRLASYQGAQPNVYMIMERHSYFDSARIQNGQVVVSTAEIDLWMWVRNLNGGSIPIVNWDYDGNNGAITRYIVIDVTGF